jgi:hypothetical protein
MARDRASQTQGLPPGAGLQCRSHPYRASGLVRRPVPDRHECQLPAVQSSAVTVLGHRSLAARPGCAGLLIVGRTFG